MTFDLWFTVALLVLVLVAAGLALAAQRSIKKVDKHGK
jgi:hypothetical protein